MQVVEEGTVKLKHLQVLGKPAISGGLAIFPHPPTDGTLSPQNQASFFVLVSRDMSISLEQAS